MRIALGNDHAGYPLKEHVRSVLEGLGHEVIDRGAPSEDPSTFPTSPSTPAMQSAKARPTAPCSCAERAQGAVMAANKIAGIRCALGHDVYSAHQSVEHDDANAIAMGAWVIGRATAAEVIEAFLNARFDNDDDTIRRVAQTARTGTQFGPRTPDEL